MRHGLAYRLAAPILLVLSAAMAVMVFWQVRPYNAVTFPEGSTGSVQPTTVRELGTITVTFPAYCNAGETVTVTRWADIYEDGRRIASEKLGTLMFYPPPRGPECFRPRVDEIGLTTAFQAYGGKPTVYVIRTETAYQPNPVRTVTMTAQTDPFTVIP